MLSVGLLGGGAPVGPHGPPVGQHESRSPAGRYHRSVPDRLAALATIVELFGWFGFVVGTPLLLIGAALRSRGRQHHETVSVVIDPPAWARSATVRYMDHEGELHEAELHGWSVATPVETEVVLHFHPDRPWRARTDPPADDGRALRTAGLVLVVVGAVCAVASIVLLFAG